MKEYMKVPWWGQPEGHLTYWGSGPKKGYDLKDKQELKRLIAEWGRARQAEGIACAKA